MHVTERDLPAEALLDFRLDSATILVHIEGCRKHDSRNNDDENNDPDNDGNFSHGSLQTSGVNSRIPDFLITRLLY